MPDIAPIGPLHSAAPAISAQRPSVDPVSPGRATARADSVELSEHARHLERLRALPSVRSAKVDAARAAIADGSYDTPGRMKLAVQRLIDELRA